jgi:peptidoglycan/LPS O-acetylase OafA/YrhL
MLALFMVPLASIIYLVAFVLMYEWWLRRDEEQAFVASGVVAGLFVAGYWVMLWLRSVRWTSARILLTLGAGGAASVAGIVVGVLLGTIEEEFGFFIGPPVAIFLWLPLTVFVWRETRRERADRVCIRETGAIVCPRCGYNMTGLRSTTCPECGTVYTIDQLIAEQRDGAAGGLERESAAAA